MRAQGTQRCSLSGSGARVDGIGQIHVDEDTERIQRQIADRGEVVDIGITFAQIIRFFIGVAELFVAHFKFDLVHLQFVHQLGVVPGCFWLRMRRLHQAGFGPMADVGRIGTWVAGAPNIGFEAEYPVILASDSGVAFA
jgi:hypothetical protein